MAIQLENIPSRYNIIFEDCVASLSYWIQISILSCIYNMNHSFWDNSEWEYTEARLANSMMMWRMTYEKKQDAEQWLWC